MMAFSVAVAFRKNYFFLPNFYQFGMLEDCPAIYILDRLLTTDRGECPLLQVRYDGAFGGNYTEDST